MAATRMRRACHARRARNARSERARAAAGCPARWATCTKTKGPRGGESPRQPGAAPSLRTSWRASHGMVLEELLVQLDVVLPLLWRLVFREDRLHRADG